MTCAIAIASSAVAQEESRWGGLQPGPYPVGFRSICVTDPARTYDFQFEDGTHYADGNNPRSDSAALGRNPLIFPSG